MINPLEKGWKPLIIIARGNAPGKGCTIQTGANAMFQIIQCDHAP